jgi:hypothetical protein
MAFYAVDSNTKENVDTSRLHVNVEKANAQAEVEAQTKMSPVLRQPVDPVPAVTAIPSEANRTRNILSFLDEIPTTSKENFSLSPVKVNNRVRIRSVGLICIGIKLISDSHVREATDSSTAFIRLNGCHKRRKWKRQIFGSWIYVFNECLFG